MIPPRLAQGGDESEGMAAARTELSPAQGKKREHRENIHQMRNGLRAGDDHSLFESPDKHASSFWGEWKKMMLSFYCSISRVAEWLLSARWNVYIRDFFIFNLNI